MPRRLFALAALLCVPVALPAQPPAKGIAFRVRLDPKQVGAKAESGRVLVAVARGSGGPTSPTTARRCSRCSARTWSGSPRTPS